MSVATMTDREAGRGFGARSDSAQEHAFRAAERHSRMVRLLRGGLPACAVLALGLYLVTGKFSLSIGDMEASVDRIEVSRESLKMVNPKLQGFDKKNGAYVIRADYAEQSVSSPDLIKLNAIRAEMNNKEKGWSKLAAKGGVFDRKAEKLTIEGDIQISTSNGMSGRLSRALIDMKSQALKSDTPVEFDLVDATVSAATMEMMSSDRKLFFRGAVKVHIRKRAEKKSADAKAGGTP